MKKILKYILFALGGVVLLLAAAVTYILLTFDPNAYKPQIIKAVKDSKQRDLKLEGDIKLALFPSIGVSLSKISLSEHKSEREFAVVDTARVSVKLLPLLSKHVVVDEVALNGVKVTLIKHKDGTLNIDDLVASGAAPEEKKAAEPAKPAAAAAPVAFDISAVSVDKTTLSYSDEGSGAKYSVQDLHVKTGRIANGVPSKAELSVTIKGNQPKVDLIAQFKGTVTFDLEKKKYRVEGMDFQAKGNAAGISNLNLAASGDAGADLAAQQFDVKKFAVNVSGAQDKNTFEAALSLPGMESNAKTFKISDLSLDAAMKQPEQAFKVKLNTPVEGNLESQQFDLPRLKLALNATGDKLPNKSVSSELGGAVRLDLKKQALAVKLEGGLLQSQIKADASVNSFEHPAIRFKADIDQFDADLYLPKKAEGAAPAQEKGKAAEPEQPFDLSGLRSLDIDGSLTLGALKVVNIKASKLRVDVKAKGGQVSVPLSLNLYDGSARLNASINAAPATPVFAVNGNLTGVNAGPLAKDAANLDIIEGKGNIALNLATQGNRVSLLKKGLNGTAGVNLGEGAIKGVNLQKLVQGIQSLGKNTKMETMGLSKDEKTVFSEFHANFKVTNGVAHNDDLSIKAPTLHVTGNGDIDIGNDSLNYTTKVTFSKTEGGGSGTLPVYLSGPFTDLKIKVDYAALIAGVAKQKIEAKKEEVKSKVQEETKAKAKEELKKGLKGLFK
ncbi:MAG TPA: AsmA family protein [Gallionellaceae bacterium]